ncbi:Hypothetical protein NTJ_06055 [Nesidiocoris tenuis]|uniref:Uncharacterized protein n=1 Tax=Nesidiocoris tenuis TaxID=355587 RepID=A0ABN7ALX5_9HEMI|nr:Hypothetical protein NTJ_06055 [Nesidiocoris tenuis]
MEWSRSNMYELVPFDIADCSRLFTRLAKRQVQPNTFQRSNHVDLLVAWIQHSYSPLPFNIKLNPEEKARVFGPPARLTALRPLCCGFLKMALTLDPSPAKLPLQFHRTVENKLPPAPS